MKFPKLLDCPHCNEIATLARDESTSPPTWKVVCTFCGASVGGREFPYTDMEKAARAWNTRGGVCIDPDDIN